MSGSPSAFWTSFSFPSSSQKPCTQWFNQLGLHLSFSCSWGAGVLGSPISKAFSNVGNMRKWVIFHDAYCRISLQDQIARCRCSHYKYHAPVEHGTRVRVPESKIPRLLVLSIPDFITHHPLPCSLSGCRHGMAMLEILPFTVRFLAHESRLNRKKLPRVLSTPAATYLL